MDEDVEFLSTNLRFSSSETKGPCRTQPKYVRFVTLIPFFHHELFYLAGQPEHKLARKDNTIALVEARKARKLANVPSGEEPLKPFTKRKEAAAKTKVESAAEGALPVAPELPYGWTFVDGSSLETPLFVHKSSGCTTVKLPKGSMMDYSDRRGLDIPAGWKTLKDNKSGRVYFWNTRSGVVQWLPPAK